MSEKCEHENFQATVAIGRLTKEEDGPVTHYSAEITVKCADCGLELEWQGTPIGSSPYHPMVSADLKELRAPMMPPGEQVPLGLPVVSLRVRGEHSDTKH